MIVMCPVCASRDIREKNVAYTELRVATWERDAAGNLQPSEFATYEDTSPEWSSTGESDPYVCHGYNADRSRCGWEGDLDELLVACDRCGESSELHHCEKCGDDLCATCYAYPCEPPDER